MQWSRGQPSQKICSPSNVFSPSRRPLETSSKENVNLPKTLTHRRELLDQRLGTTTNHHSSPPPRHWLNPPTEPCPIPQFIMTHSHASRGVHALPWQRRADIPHPSAVWLELVCVVHTSLPIRRRRFDRSSLSPLLPFPCCCRSAAGGRRPKGCALRGVVSRCFLVTLRISRYLRCERGDGPVLCRMWPGWLVDRRRRRRLVFGTWEWEVEGDWGVLGSNGLRRQAAACSVPTSCDPTVTLVARWFLQEAYQFGISFLSALSAGIGGATRSLPIKCRCGACRKASSAEVVGLAQSYARSASRILTTSYLSACRYSRPGLSFSFHFASRKVIAASMSSRGRVASLPRRQSSPEKPVMSSGCLRGTAESAQHGYD
jgi:hypothetical protein